MTEQAFYIIGGLTLSTVIGLIQWSMRQLILSLKKTIEDLIEQQKKHDNQLISISKDTYQLKGVQIQHESSISRHNDEIMKTRERLTAIETRNSLK